MKRLAAAMALAGVLVVPGMARADSSTDAALGLGAFAVFNQILGGTGIFGGGRTVVVEREVVYAPPPPRVVYAPRPPAVVYAPPPPVYYGGYAYAPARPVVVYPQPVYVAPRHRHAGYGYHGHNGHRGHGHGHR
jgi:hypothetical protein